MLPDFLSLPACTPVHCRLSNTKPGSYSCTTSDMPEASYVAACSQTSSTSACLLTTNRHCHSALRIMFKYNESLVMLQNSQCGGTGDHPDHTSGVRPLAHPASEITLDRGPAGLLMFSCYTWYTTNISQYGVGPWTIDILFHTSVITLLVYAEPS